MNLQLLYYISIECEGWRRHSSLIFLILLLTKPNIEVSGWLYQTKTHFTHIVYQPFSRVSPPSFTLYDHTSIVLLVIITHDDIFILHAILITQLLRRKTHMWLHVYLCIKQNNYSVSDNQSASVSFNKCWQNVQMNFYFSTRNISFLRHMYIHFQICCL